MTFREPVSWTLSPDFVYVYMNRIENQLSSFARLCHYFPEDVKWQYQEIASFSDHCVNYS